MEKVVLSALECGLLVPHWPELSTVKLRRLESICTRNSKFVQGQRIVVIDAPPILITPFSADEGERYFILNGKHRAVVCTAKMHNSEAYIAKDIHDIVYHVPRRSFGDLEVARIEECFEQQEFYASYCKKSGVNSINDLVPEYLGLMGSIKRVDDKEC